MDNAKLQGSAVQLNCNALPDCLSQVTIIYADNNLCVKSVFRFNCFTDNSQTKVTRKVCRNKPNTN